MLNMPIRASSAARCQRFGLDGEEIFDGKLGERKLTIIETLAFQI